MKKIVEKIGFLCPYCPKETDVEKDEYLLRIYASSKENKSFSVNPEGILNSWSNYHRKLMQNKLPSYPGGLKYKVIEQNQITGEDEEVEIIVNKSNCLDFYQKFEFTNQEWSRINGLKRKQTSRFKQNKAIPQNQLPI